MVAEIKLHLKASLVGVFRELLDSVNADGRITGSKWREDGDDVRVIIPVKEAGAWMEITQELADNERDGDENKADQLELIADVIEEEAEKILDVSGKGVGELTGLPPEIDDIPDTKRPMGRNFWKGM
ncbi:MAG: hypothetical protein GZ088_09850 [Acidipila sp.]|nr:hypothetical protein [Acidipila sp.]